jgi:hypothetical protein
MRAMPRLPFDATEAAAELRLDRDTRHGSVLTRSEGRLLLIGITDHHLPHVTFHTSIKQMSQRV